MRVFVGTSGYSYKEWKGTFYPPDMAASEMLGYYASRFRTVEINNTFYRMPTEKLLVQWSEQVPPDFAFVLKASRRITHVKRLQGVEDDLRYLLQTVSVLGDRRGPMLFQLPPNMKADVSRLKSFLELLPTGWRIAFEFRHASWFAQEVHETLRGGNAALVIADTDDGDPPTQVVETSDWGYVRLRREEYDRTALTDWAERLARRAWEDVFVFFKHEDEGAGPRLAAEFSEVCSNIASP